MHSKSISRSQISFPFPPSFETHSFICTLFVFSVVFLQALLMCGDDMNQAGAWLLDHEGELSSYDGVDETLPFLSDNDEHGFDRAVAESDVRDSISFSCMQLGNDHVCVPKSLDDLPSVRPGALVSVLEYAERTSSKQYSREMLGKVICILSLHTLLL
jgi:hypothetical protein